jgi:hypothetical protein
MDKSRIDRSPMGLVDGICSRIKSVLTPSWWLESEFKDTEYQEPFIHAQYEPVSLTENPYRDQSKDFPKVLVSCTSGSILDFSTTSLSSHIVIQMQFGAWCDNTDRQGWRLSMAMLWRVLQDFSANPIVGGYKMLDIPGTVLGSSNIPIMWSPVVNPNPPYYMAVAETIWQGRVPMAQFPVGITEPIGGTHDIG